MNRVKYEAFIQINHSRKRTRLLVLNALNMRMRVKCIPFEREVNHGLGGEKIDERIQNHRVFKAQKH